MSWMHGMRARMRLLLRGAAEERMDEEIRFHLETGTRPGAIPRSARCTTSRPGEESFGRSRSSGPSGRWSAT
jgi:hypothetical protein